MKNLRNWFTARQWRFILFSVIITFAIHALMLAIESKPWTPGTAVFQLINGIVLGAILWAMRAEAWKDAKFQQRKKTQA